MLSYLLLSSLGVVLFSILGHCLCNNDTFLKLRRMYYIAAVLMSLVLPLLGLFMDPLYSSLMLNANPKITIGTPMVVTMAEEISDRIWYEAILEAVPWILKGVILLGAMFMLLRNLMAYMRIKRIFSRSQRYLDSPVFFGDSFSVPFTFINLIYLPSELRGSSVLPYIVRHEMEHLRGKHFIDLLILNLLKTVQWYNPFAYLLYNDANKNLEYIADKAVLTSHYNSREYQYKLLEVSLPTFVRPICTTFNNNFLKDRIMMMNRKQSSKHIIVRYALIIPVAALLIVGSNVLYAKRSSDNIDSKTVFTPLSEDKVEEQVVAKQSVEEAQPQKKAVIATSAHFPGGEVAMMRFIANNLSYPESAIKKNIQGRVLLSFFVKKDGSISNIKVEKSLTPNLDNEAIACVKKMPKFVPALTKDNRPVESRIFLPFSFKLVDSAEVVPEEAPDNQNAEEAFVVVDEQPQFKGGTKALMQYLNKNLVYPKDNKQNGTVIIQFVIKKDGSVANAKVLRSLNKKCDEAALKVIMEMPKWIPGKQDGKPVDVKFTIPVSFMLK